MGIKLIVLDLDDTLLNDELKITDKTKKALLDAQKNGITVALCSGRPTHGMMPIAKELELETLGGYVISYNGANIYNAKEHKLIHENNLSKEDIHRLYDLSVANNVGIHTYFEDVIVAQKPYKYTKFESDLVGMDIMIVDDFKKAVDRDVVKAIMVDEPSELNKISDNLKSLVSDKMNVTFSKPFFLEFMDKGTDKGIAVKFLCEKLGIDIKDTIVFGDSFNDLPMLKVAGISVCMENGLDEVKEICDFVTKSNNDDGICFALEKYLNQ